MAGDKQPEVGDGELVAEVSLARGLWLEEGGHYKRKVVGHINEENSEVEKRKGWLDDLTPSEVLA